MNCNDWFELQWPRQLLDMEEDQRYSASQPESEIQRHEVYLPLSWVNKQVAFGRK